MGGGSGGTVVGGNKREERKSRPDQSKTRAGLRRAPRPPMLSKQLIGGLPEVCNCQLTVWEGARRERPRPVRPLPLPLPLSPAKLSATDDKLSPFVGNRDRDRAQGRRGPAQGPKDKLPPSGPACSAALMHMDPNTNTVVFPRPSPRIINVLQSISCQHTFCPAQTPKPTPRV
jgi:hypothetical protein